MTYGRVAGVWALSFEGCKNWGLSFLNSNYEGGYLYVDSYLVLPMYISVA
jgi:hypothetical protein